MDFLVVIHDDESGLEIHFITATLNEQSKSGAEQKPGPFRDACLQAVAEESRQCDISPQTYLSGCTVTWTPLPTHLPRY